MIEAYLQTGVSASVGERVKVCLDVKCWGEHVAERRLNADQ